MFVNHPAFVDPENDSLTLWRYIELEKLVSLVETSELFFCRANYFCKDDPSEGTFPQKEFDFLLRHIGEEATRNIYEISKKNTFINCWHLSENESMAMWKLYSQNNKGVALQTDIQSFKNSFVNSDQTIFAGMVQYLDYENDCYYERSGYKYFSGNIFSAYIHKRVIFDYEKEYRAICADIDHETDQGIKIKVTLDQLIHKIFLAPNSSDENYELVAALASKVSDKIEVRKSSFDSKSYY